MNKLITLLMVIFIFILGSGIGAAAEIHVNSSESIQAAVNSAISGDSIIVGPGTYSENIDISKPNLVIRSESGNPQDTIIVAKNSNSNVFHTTANNTTISGFKVTSGGYTRVTGINLGGCSYCMITNNELSDNYLGIDLVRSERNMLFNNIANSNDGHGIVLENSNNNNLTSNIASSNTGFEKGFGFYLANSNGNTINKNTANKNNRGIYLRNSNTTKILSNDISENYDYGILISFSNYNTISRNTANETSRGIHLDSAGSNTVSGNIVASNDVSGFFMCKGCHRNLFFNNYLNNFVNADVNNTDNIWNTTKIAGRNIVGGPYIGGNFWASPAGTGFSETAQDKNGDGISDTQYIWLNKNGTNVTDYLPLVSVSNPEQLVLPVANFSTNVTNGTAPLAIQFTDLSQNSLSRSWDIDSNGIQDYNSESFIHVYKTPGNYTATLRVSNENGKSSKTQEIIVQKVKILPVADFNTSVTSGYAPLSVQFTDASQNAESRSWDFNSDGIADSGEVSPGYTYTAPGNYTATLTVSNANGTASKITQINVLTESDSNGGSSDSSGSSSSSHSSGGSGGSGGGAGGSPEPAKNVEVKELSQAFVSSGNSVKFDFPRNATSVVYVNFDSKKTAGKTTTIAEMLKEKSILVSGLPSDEVYKSLNIWVGNSGFATPKNIEKAVICFKVEKSWIQDRKIEQSSITLNRYSDKKWNQLPTILLSEDDKYLYFTAQTPGFSPFAITGKTIAKEAVTETQPATGTKTQSEPNTENTENNGSTGADIKQQPEQKKSVSTPGFEAICGIVGILAVFLRKRK
jgi:PGF-pre-PGF domain-containing protein